MLAPHPRRPSAPASITKSKTSQPSYTSSRRPTLKRSIDGTEPMQLSSSPTKRSRVTFDTNVEIVSADDEEDLDPLVVKEQVRRAIQRHLLRDNEALEQIKSVFAMSPDEAGAPSNKVMKIHLQAMLANISNLRTDCGGLVSTVLNSEWIGRDESYFTMFVRFLGNLGAAQSGHVMNIMRVLVDLLGPQKTRRLPDCRPIRQPRIHRRTFQTIQYITQLVPIAGGALADCLIKKLNFEFSKADDRMIYIRSFMELIKYVPELTSEILTAVMRQLIKLDTEVQAELDEEEDMEDEILQHMSESQTLAITAGLQGSIISDEDEDMSTTDESESEDEDDLDPSELRRKRLKEGVKQVDMIMETLFHYYSKLTTSTTLQTGHDAIEQLLSQFRNLILPTSRSRHPQFLLFHFAQSDPINVDRFVSFCTDILFDKRQPLALRQALAAHFSGFIGRGAHVSSSVVQHCVIDLCNHMEKLRKDYEPTCKNPDLKRYGDFYSIFQAVMYIFCFRWRDIGSSLYDSDGESDIADDNDRGIQKYEFPESLYLALDKAVMSPLNPLRVCTPAVVEQFAKITTALQYMFIYSKIEQNRRVRLVPALYFSRGDLDFNQVSRDTNWVDDDGMLEGYFPYDPYHLPISRHWIENDYVQWQGILGDVDDSDSDPDDEIEMEADEDEDTMDSDNY